MSPLGAKRSDLFHDALHGVLLSVMMCLSVPGAKVLGSLRVEIKSVLLLMQVLESVADYSVAAGVPARVVL